MKLKPWYDVVKPREDLREGKSQDASEFAVHLDRVRDGTGRADYTNPEQFFAKTYLATNLLDLASQVVRRMSGETSHTSPVFNLATNFGGGKTHSLTLRCFFDFFHMLKAIDHQRNMGTCSGGLGDSSNILLVPGRVTNK